jgi:hypothetical protein
MRIFRLLQYASFLMSGIDSIVCPVVDFSGCGVDAGTYKNYEMSARGGRR